VVDLVGPALEREVRLRLGPLAVPSPPTAEALDLALPEVPYGGLGRVVVLQDQPTYRVSFASQSLVEVPTQRQLGGRQGAFGFAGVRNDRILHPQTGTPVHRVTASNVFRGSAGFRRIVLATGPTLQCLPALSDAPPALALVPSPPAGIPGTEP
jgi:hypothetical protein